MYFSPTIPRKRRVFFSFHFQFDIWRVNQIRQSWRYKHEWEREAEGFFDASIWERAKLDRADSLKRLIRDGLKNTSVTCVLTGSHTYLRRWVRYEIARSVAKQNGLLTVQVHNMRNQRGALTLAGRDPLSHMGVYGATGGQIRIAEINPSSNQWQQYQDFKKSVDLPSTWTPPSLGKVIPLNFYTLCFDYAKDEGVTYFPKWITLAANQVNS